MKRLFGNKKEKNYRYAIVALLLAFSASLAFSPTGLVAYTSSANEKKLVDTAFGSERVREFVASRDVGIMIEKVQDDARRLYPAVYSGLPSPVYQLILDAGENSLVVILDENAVYRIFEN